MTIWRENTFLELKYCFWTKFKANYACLYFFPKRVLKKPHRNDLTVRNVKHVQTLELLKRIYFHSCLWEAAIKECSLKIIVLRGSHSDVFSNITFLNLLPHSLKNICDGCNFGKFALFPFYLKGYYETLTLEHLRDMVNLFLFIKDWGKDFKLKQMSKIEV